MYLVWGLWDRYKLSHINITLSLEVMILYTMSQVNVFLLSEIMVNKHSKI